MLIRDYKTEDYDPIVALYKDSTIYGGQFDEDRDSKERLEKVSANTLHAILVAEDNGNIVGTVSLFEDERLAWLFRFAVAENEVGVAKALYIKAVEILKSKGHTQVLVYAPAGDKQYEKRYHELGFNIGNDYTCYWRDLS